MNKLASAFTVVAIAGTANYAAAQNQLETTLDLAIRSMMDEGSKVSYGERIIGSDGSVEYVDLVVTVPGEEITFSADWVKGVPSASDPEVVTFTVADIINVTVVAEDVDFAFDIKSSGLELTTNGLLRDAMNKADVSVTFMADSFLIDGGDPDSPVLRKIYADMGEVDFELTASQENMFVEGSLTTGKFDIAYDYTIEGQTQVTDQKTESVSVSFEFDVPEDENDAIGYLDGSKSANFEMKSGPSEFVTSMDAEGVVLDMAGTSGSSAMVLKMADGSLTYDVSTEGFDMVVTPGTDMPIPPVEISMGEMGMKLIIPAGSADAPAEMLVDILFADLVVGEGLWSLIDPEQTISRDPAQLDIDLEALVQIDTMSAISGEDPTSAGTIHSLDINQILLSAGGASIQADSAATFTNSGPIPMPLGSINIELNGISTLTNQLVALGLLDQMQAGMAMGMMMAFGKPGPEVDQFISEITFTENGVLANGQPIQ